MQKWIRGSQHSFLPHYEKKSKQKKGHTYGKLWSSQVVRSGARKYLVQQALEIVDDQCFGKVVELSQNSPPLLQCHFHLHLHHHHRVLEYILLVVALRQLIFNKSLHSKIRTVTYESKFWGCNLLYDQIRDAYWSQKSSMNSKKQKLHQLFVYIFFM